MAVQSALGTNLPETVEAIRTGVVGIRIPVHLEQELLLSARAGEVPDSASCGGDARAELLLRETLNELLGEDERTSITNFPDRWGIVMGTTLAGMRHSGSGLRDELSGHTARSDISYGHTVASSVLSHAIKNLGISGPTINVSCACASALSAISHGCTLLESGDVDFVIAGGYDPIAEFSYGGFAALQLISPNTLSPFSKDRAGMKIGEGVALVILRRLQDVPLESSQEIIGYIAATAETSDAHHLTQPHPTGNGLAAALAQVLDVDHLPNLLIAHATGTLANDAAEYQAYRSVFGSKLKEIPVVALKSRFGHPLGAAGALELIASIACAESGFLPTSAGASCDHEAFPDLHLLQGEVPTGAPREIVALSAGFGGANAALRFVRGPGHPTSGSDLKNTPSLQSDRSILITGVGAVSPAGRGIDAMVVRTLNDDTWGELELSTLAPLLDHSKTRRFAMLPRIMIAAIRDLVETSGLTPEELATTPLIAANWCGTPEFTIQFYRDLIASGINLANPILFAESVPNIGSAHCSIALGIQAASLSVIGRRTAGFEAIALASAKIKTGAWTRAIVVAAEEAHQVTERILSRCANQPIQLRSSGIALLLEPRSVGLFARGRRSIAITKCIGRTAALEPSLAESAVLSALGPSNGLDQLCVTSSSPLDQFVQSLKPNVTQVRMPELGATSAFLSVFAGVSIRDLSDKPFASVTSDPHGSCWAVTLR